MRHSKHVYRLVITALLTAFTCVATMTIQIPTPPTGYIHPGDALVILSGIILGPALGSFAAGVGSMLADLFSGYVLYAIPTLIIKGLSAMIAGYAYHKLKQKFNCNQLFSCLMAGLLCELNVVCGYFVNGCLSPMILTATYNIATLTAGTTASLIGIPLNILQGGVGLLISMILLPILTKVPDIKNAYQKNKL